ncbi:MAG: circadian clock protein KaiC [Gemmatimonadetes bacterium]|nr:circadian clock protein KaiC [Gemmatimonadota bacterium]
MKARSAGAPPPTLPKARTGILGLDEITFGGLPRGRPSLVCGSAGAGKTMLAMEFLVRGAQEFGEPGVCLTFEETTEEIAANVRSLGFDLEQLVAEGKVAVDYVHIERSEIEETGEYDLEGLFIRLGHAVDRIGAKRVVLDTLEALFAGLPNHGILRAELRRLFRWLKDRGLTAVITGERGETTLTRFGLEEYVADCVLVLDHRVHDSVSTRRLRVVKYRGSAHGTNEYPFLIGAKGISVLPVTSLRLDHAVSEELVSTGVPRLDEMLGGRGLYRGASMLVSGAPGTGKSSLGAAMAQAACARGERALIFAFEESPAQILRNMRSIGLDLAPALKQGRLQIHSSRPTLTGLEQHLVRMHDTMTAFQPDLVVVDPITNLTAGDDERAIKPMLMRLIDFLKQSQITSVFTSLTHGATSDAVESSEVEVSSLMDTWLLVRNLEADGERNRTLYVLKSRGMAHSNQVREFVLSSRGIDLVDVYLGDGRVLTGSARLAQEAREAAGHAGRRREEERRQRLARTRRKGLEARIAALQAELEAERFEEQAREGDAASEGAVAAASLERLRAARGGTTPGTHNGHVEARPGRRPARP